MTYKVYIGGGRTMVERTWPCGATSTEPSAYADWEEWANKKAKTHKQTRCHKCGRWHIWVRRIRKGEAGE